MNGGRGGVHNILLVRVCAVHISGFWSLNYLNKGLTWVCEISASHPRLTISHVPPPPGNDGRQMIIIFRGRTVIDYQLVTNNNKYQNNSTAEICSDNCLN